MQISKYQDGGGSVLRITGRYVVYGDTYCTDIAGYRALQPYTVSSYVGTLCVPIRHVPTLERANAAFAPHASIDSGIRCEHWLGKITHFGLELGKLSFKRGRKV